MVDSDVEFIAEEENENPAAALKKVREKLAACVKEKQEYLEGWQRARADFTNYTRTENDRDEEREVRLRAEFTESLIPVLDAFETAFNNPDFDISIKEEWKKGLKGLRDQLLISLKKFGVEQFGQGLEGKPFDPKEHEALRQEEVTDPALDNTIIEVGHSGYRLGDRIIRAAQVTVGAFTQK